MVDRAKIHFSCIALLSSLNIMGTGCDSKPEHAPMLDGYALYAHANQDGSAPADLDECGGHTDAIRGYHYHAGAAGSNQIIKGFRGIPGTMTVADH